MQIHQHASVCPYGHKAPQQADNKPFDIDEIPCPVLKTGVREGRLQVDEYGNCTGLNDFLKDDIGAKYMLRKVAVLGANRTSADGVWDALTSDSFNLRALKGSNLDHNADSQILRNGFSQERLDKALTFSSDGERLTLKDLRRYQEALLEEEPGQRGEIFGGAEFSLVVEVFGRTDAEGNRFIMNKDFVRLFKENRFPEDWTARPGSLGFYQAGSAMAEFFADGSSDQDPGVTAALSTQEAKKGAAACPFMQGQTVDPAEAARHHADQLQ